ncbi:hypothetical protein H0H93_014241, partial [Arthromyces matolae]
GFRVVRLLGVSNLLFAQSAGRADERIDPDSTTLTAACVWLVNGLHARPEDGPASRQLLECVLPRAFNVRANQRAIRPTSFPSIRRTNNPQDDAGIEELEPHYSDEEEEEDEEEDRRGPVDGTAHLSLGCVFFRALHLDGVPRLAPGGRTLNDAATKFWFGMSQAELEAKFPPFGIVDAATLRERRSTTARRKLPLSNPDGPQSQPFSIPHIGTETLPLLRLHPDMEDDVPEPPEEEGDVNDEVAAIYSQFVIDLYAKSPNPEGIDQSSYMKLSDEQRRTYDETPLKSLSLLRYFNHVAYKNADGRV